MTTEFRRTPDDNFAGLRGFDYPPDYLDWEGLRMHYVDAAPADGPERVNEFEKVGRGV